MANRKIRTEKRTGHVTIQTPVYSNGFLFAVNHQYPFLEIAFWETGCGCGGKKKKIEHFYLLDAGKDGKHSINKKHLVETDRPIPKVSQSFDVARRDQHRSQQPYHDFSDIVSHPDPDAIWKHANEQARDTWKHNDWNEI